LGRFPRVDLPRLDGPKGGTLHRPGGVNERQFFWHQSVVDLATSFHKTARHRASLTWDPLALLAAVYSLLLAITMWFKIWSIRDVAAIGHYFSTLTLCVEFFLPFLIAGASLPDCPKETCDLRSYYDNNRQ
jgi:hypothetical protein